MELMSLVTYKANMDDLLVAKVALEVPSFHSKAVLPLVVKKDKYHMENNLPLLILLVYDVSWKQRM